MDLQKKQPRAPVTPVIRIARARWLGWRWEIVGPRGGGGWALTKRRAKVQAKAAVRSGDLRGRAR